MGTYRKEKIQLREGRCKESVVKRMTPKKVYTVTVQILMDEKPEEKRIEINGYKGRVLRVERDQKTSKYIVEVMFNVTSLVEVMVATDERFISRSVH